MEPRGAAKSLTNATLPLSYPSSFAPQTDLIGCKAEGIFILAHREEEGLTRETRDILGRIPVAVG